MFYDIVVSIICVVYFYKMLMFHRSLYKSEEYSIGQVVMHGDDKYKVIKVIFSKNLDYPVYQWQKI